MSVELGVPDRLVNCFWPGKNWTWRFPRSRAVLRFPAVSPKWAWPPARKAACSVSLSKYITPRGYQVGHDGNGQSRRSDALCPGHGAGAAVGPGYHFRFRVRQRRKPGPLGWLGGQRRQCVNEISHANEQRGRATPESAQLAVFVVKEGKATRRPVKTGDILSSSIIITEGLQGRRRSRDGGSKLPLRRRARWRSFRQPQMQGKLAWQRTSTSSQVRRAGPIFCRASGGQLADARRRAGLGRLVFGRLGQQEDPTIPHRTAMLVTAFPGATASKVEELVTKPIERKVSELQSIEEIKSQSRPGCRR